jgi:hypothetical protein
MAVMKRFLLGFPGLAAAAGRAAVQGYSFYFSERAVADRLASIDAFW